LEGLTLSCLENATTLEDIAAMQWVLEHSIARHRRDGRRSD